MKIREHLLDTPAGLLHYQVIGTGPTPLLAFHGFDQNGTVFHDIQEKISDQYTVYAFDIFYHGMSSRSTNKPLTRTLWNRAFEQFCITESIKNFEVLGYSMGGKFAIASIFCRPAYCKAFIGIAPDGIRPSFWYDLATYPIGLQKVFRQLINRPQLLFSFINSLERLHLVDKSLVKFAKQQLATEALRQLVYLVWVMFRDLQYKQNQIAGIINQYNIKSTFYLGTYDRLLRPHALDSFFKKLNVHQRIELPVSHGQLLHRCLEELVI